MRIDHISKSDIPSCYREMELTESNLRDIGSNLLLFVTASEENPPSHPEILRRNVYRLLRETATLRWLSSLRTGTIPTTPTMLDLRAVIDAVCRLWNSGAEDGPRALLPMGPTFYIPFDRIVFTTLVSRLLLLADARTTAMDTVTFALRQDENTFSLAVTDTGCPLTPETCRILSGPDGCTAGNYCLGDVSNDAVVVWLLTAALGGDLLYRPAGGTGTAVTVTLPYAPEVMPLPDKATLRMEYVVADGIDPALTELSPRLRAEAFGKQTE